MTFGTALIHKPLGITLNKLNTLRAKINLLKTKRNQLYIRNQLSVLRSTQKI